MTKEKIFNKKFYETDNSYDNRRNRDEIELLGAIRGLGKQVEKQAVDQLISIISDFDSTFMSNTVSASAAWALGEIGGEKAVSFLNSKIQDITMCRSLGTAVIGALGKIGDENSGKLLTDLLTGNDGNSDTRKALNTIFSLDNDRFNLAVIKALVLLKGIDVTKYDSYYKVPSELYITARFLPVEKRLDIKKSHESYYYNSNEIVNEFEIYAEQYYGDSVRLRSFSGRELSSFEKKEIALQALTRAKRTMMSIYGLKDVEVEEVVQRYRNRI